MSPDEEFVVSGGADSVINVWRDDTKEQDDKVIKAREREVQHASTVAV